MVKNVPKESFVKVVIEIIKVTYPFGDFNFAVSNNSTTTDFCLVIYNEKVKLKEYLAIDFDLSPAENVRAHKEHIEKFIKKVEFLKEQNQKTALLRQEKVKPKGFIYYARPKKLAYRPSIGQKICTMNKRKRA